jgi:hypothetical protein
MGDRGQVFIKDTGVYLYTHWGASDLINRVKEALAKKRRWGDAEYLARIIFDCMKGKDTESETGYGIGTNQHGDIWRLITVDCENRTIRVEDFKVRHFHGSFDEFLDSGFSPSEEVGE